MEALTLPIPPPFAPYRTHSWGKPHELASLHYTADKHSVAWLSWHRENAACQNENWNVCVWERP